MSTSVKSQILARVVDTLSELITHVSPTAPGTIRGVTRALDPLASSKRLPWLFVYDGEEIEIEQDNFGRTYEFPLTVKALIESHNELAELKDALVPEIQRVLESDTQLRGTSANPIALSLEGGNEQPYIDELGKPLGGALVLYTVRYRRKLGDPYTSY